MWTIERMNYSSHPWRLLDEAGQEVYQTERLELENGSTSVQMPVCGQTKQEVIDKVLGGFVKMRSMLQQSIKAGNEEAIRWVSVSDRLPDDGLEVLLVVSRGDGSDVASGWVYTGDGETMDGWDVYGFGCVPMDRVSHWAEMPTGPKV